MASLQTSRLTQADYKRTTHHVDAPRGDTVADMLNPTYWSNVGRMLKPLDIIEVVAEDNSFEASFRVISATVNWAKVILRSHVPYRDSPEFAVPAPASVDYEVEHAGNFHKWRVIRKSDKSVVASKLASEDDARAALKQHIITLSRTTPKAAAE